MLLIERFSTSGLAHSYVDGLAAEGIIARVLFRPHRGHNLTPFLVERIAPNEGRDVSRYSGRVLADTQAD
ncbi:hypothetical protein [Chelativorans sp. M5D2P16]|uniref:hypothetical protein n=1 Tax=Chelativorans sp. M5D2P16 TaxID=3095678 RepID=UPI002ACA816A|nr:hypothetical protein [Chelativorans sp. M5D2P16]MDZ5697817.1 hypothetical protein [Chelativorans sp. M5D2P16]